MKHTTVKNVRAVLTALALVVAQNVAGATAAAPPPNPVLYLSSMELFQQGGKQYVRYRFGVENFAQYPAELFAAAPDLPPCGKNTKSSRTWVDVYDQAGKRLQGFCAFGKAEDLNSIWFAAEEGTTPPSWVYIELTDRKTNTKYKSNLAETTM